MAYPKNQSPQIPIIITIPGRAQAVMECTCMIFAQRIESPVSYCHQEKVKTAAVQGLKAADLIGVIVSALFVKPVERSDRPKYNYYRFQ